MKYQDAKLDDLLGTLIDYRGKTPPKTGYGIPLITAKVIKGGHILDGNHEYIAEDYYDEWMRRGLPHQWDVLITTEAPLGEVAILKSSAKVALAQRVILLRGDKEKINQRYLCFALQSPLVQARLNARATGATVAGIKQSELREVLLPVYQVPTQRRIASILSAYDDLIENNTRRIAILEEMARRIYEEWFVRFRFPGHEQVKMVESELGLIPEGWSWGRLRDIAADVRDSINPEATDPSTPYVGLEHIPRRSIGLSDWGFASEVQSTKLRFKSGDILFGKIRPYFHKVAVAPISGVASSDAIVIRAKKSAWYSLVLATVSSDAFVAEATQSANGTKMPRANWNVLLDYKVPIPSATVLNKFNDFMSGVVGFIGTTTMKNRNLRATRDLLLPKLISGELDVSSLPEPEEGITA
ncbi:restriction endonuclease subunit S [Desulfovibrio desulfuricans]|uniref:restriction endonuclease subunit S n=1 Tax=Desulfovibrio desulfuricans TaxID=876 RepID=UPI0035B3D47F